MPRTRPMITRGGSIDGIVSDSQSVFEELRTELQDWADNLSGNNMEHLPKYEELTEAISQLDEAVDNQPDYPETLLPGMTGEIQWQEKAPYKGEQSRSERRSAATSDLSVVVSEITAAIDAIENTDEEGISDLITEWEAYRDAVEEILEAADQVEFPRMY